LIANMGAGHMAEVAPAGTLWRFSSDEIRGVRAVAGPVARARAGTLKR